MSRRIQKKRENEKGYLDYNLMFLVLFLLAFGLIMIYSSSSYEAMLKFGDAAYYFKKQLFATVIGLVVMFAVMIIDYRIWKKFAWAMYFAAIVLVALVKTPLGITANGATRWLRIGPLSFQPAEAAKVAIIVLYAYLISSLSANQLRDIKVIAKIFIIGAILAGEIYILTSNMSSAFIVMGIGFLTLFIASPDTFIYVAFMVGVFLAIALGVYLIVSGVIPEEVSFRFARVRAWMDPEAYASGKGFQTLQALYAIGSGGVLGKGLGHSMQKLDFLPEAQNDMIFSIICEELGLFGAALVIFEFAMLIYRGVNVAQYSKDRFGALIAVGVAVHLALQVILNIAVVTNTIPNTGITLPFISYGGTSIVFLMIEMGFLLSISRKVTFE